MFDTTTPHRLGVTACWCVKRTNPSSAQVPASTCHSPWVTLKARPAPGPQFSEVARLQCDSLDLTPMAPVKSQDLTGQIKSVLQPPHGTTGFFPLQSSPHGTTGIFFPGPEESRPWRGLGRRLLCRAGGAAGEASMPGRWCGRVAHPECPTATV